MNTTVRWWWLPVVLFAGTMLGGYGAFKGTHLLLMDGFYGAVLSHTKISLRALTAIRSGDVPEAVEELERSVNANLQFLSASKDDAGRARVEDIDAVEADANRYWRDNTQTN